MNVDLAAKQESGHEFTRAHKQFCIFVILSGVAANATMKSKDLCI